MLTFDEKIAQVSKNDITVGELKKLVCSYSDKALEVFSTAKFDENDKIVLNMILSGKEFISKVASKMATEPSNVLSKIYCKSMMVIVLKKKVKEINFWAEAGNTKIFSGNKLLFKASSEKELMKMINSKPIELKEKAKENVIKEVKKNTEKISTVAKVVPQIDPASSKEKAAFTESAKPIKIVDRVDLEVLYKYISEKSVRNLDEISMEDKAHVMDRVSNALKIVASTNPKNKEKLLNPKEKYGFSKPLFKDKDNFILPNGKKFMVFTSKAGGAFNFVNSLSEADTWIKSLEEKQTEQKKAA